MSAKFYTLLTEIGAAKLANAAALGVPLKITQMAVGDGGGTLPTPNAQQTALVAEKRRAALNMLYIDPQNRSQIVAEQVIPETEGGWWIREVGLFDETGALIAVGNCPESYKPQLAEGSGRTQTVRMVLITSSTDNITLKIDPAVVLATRKYVDDVAAKKQPLDDTLTILSGKDVSGIIQYLSLGAFISSPSTKPENFTQVNSPDGKGYLFIANNNNWGAQKEDGTPIPLSVERGGTGSGTASGARDKLGLGNSATKNTGTTKDTVAAGDDDRINGSMQKQKNGADIPDVALFLKNIGLEAFVSFPSARPESFSQVNSPDGTCHLFIANNNNWGAQEADGTPIPLSVERGGTGSGTASGARNKLGLGDSATKNVGDTPGTVAAGNDKRLTSLKSAANRDVGTGANQIPDMSAYTSGPGWMKFPDGTILQRGSGATSISGNTTINLPIPFASDYTITGSCIDPNVANILAISKLNNSQFQAKTFAEGVVATVVHFIAWGK